MKHKGKTSLNLKLGKTCKGKQREWFFINQKLRVLRKGRVKIKLKNKQKGRKGGKQGGRKGRRGRFIPGVQAERAPLRNY